MPDREALHEIARRRTFAIISHPDAGKTTLTEKLLLFGGAVRLAGTVKGRKAARHATSDWMELEKQRGISVTSSVMQFPCAGRIVNLLDTPGHEDFSEDTYRTLTAVDSALMVIDGARGIEARTIRLMEVCRLRDTPIVTFVNKMDRESREPIELLDEIERVLGLRCAPVTWPIGSGRRFKGVHHLLDDRIHFFSARHDGRIVDGEVVEGIGNPALDERLGPQAGELREEVELVRGASHALDADAYLAATLTPVFFGSALNNFGVRELLETFVELAPPPGPRTAVQRTVAPGEDRFSGFVFKIQANMDPQHRDRIAFLRITSGRYRPGMRIRHVRTGKDVQVANAITFMARERDRVDDAWAGDVIGLPNHGTIRIGDTFSQGEALKFTGIPSFAPELFPPCGAPRSVAPEGPAERARPIERGRGHAGVPPPRHQRPRSRGGGRAAVRRGRLATAPRVRGGEPLRAGGRDDRALGALRRPGPARSLPPPERLAPRARQRGQPRIPRPHDGQPEPRRRALARRRVPRHPRGLSARAVSRLPDGRYVSMRRRPPGGPRTSDEVRPPGSGGIDSPEPSRIHDERRDPVRQALGGPIHRVHGRAGGAVHRIGERRPPVREARRPGSIAHATMLAEVGVLSEADRDAIVSGLEAILAEIEAGAFEWRVALEDVHMNVESVLTERIGDAGKRLHTGRSRNDRSPPACGCSCARHSTTSPGRSARCRA